MDALMMEAPPQSVNEALRLPNARQWDAREGCYVISPLHRHEVPVHLANYTQPMYYNTLPGDAVIHGPTLNSFGTGGSGTTPPFVNAPVDQNFTNFDQTGAMFSGLTPQTTLTVNYRLYVEVFPTASNALANFSKPSPLYDPLALQLYADICWKAPIGVEVKYNGLGDWFMDGIKSVSAALGPAAHALSKVVPHKGLKTAAIAMQGVNKVVKGQQKQLPKGGKKMHKATQGLELPVLSLSKGKKKK